MADRTGPMTCPIDGATLTMSERQGIEIDYCPQCRGVWLDRGELDKIIERNAAPPTPVQQGPYEQPSRTRAEDPRGYDDGGSYGHGGRRRRKSFLSELFD